MGVVRATSPLLRCSWLRCCTAWVGDEGAASQGNGDGENTPVESDLVPLAAPDQVANEAATGSEKQPVSMGRKLGDGSYVPAPSQQRNAQQESCQASSTDAAVQDKKNAPATANDGTIAEFDLPKIMRHIKELNYLVRRFAHTATVVSAEIPPFALLSYRNSAAEANCCCRFWCSPGC